MAVSVTQFAYGYTETAGCSTYIRVLKIILTHPRTNQDVGQEYEAACRRLQQIYATGEHCGKSHSLYSR